MEVIDWLISLYLKNIFVAPIWDQFSVEDDQFPFSESQKPVVMGDFLLGMDFFFFG